MTIKDLDTKEEITWCPGCPNYGILMAFKEAIVELSNRKKIQAKDAAIVTGIGCHAKSYDYLNLNGFYGIHGRVLPVCLGIKIGNPQLTVIGFGGDGDTYAEGMSHFIHAGRHNADLTMIVHNNQAFSLTTGQATPTSEKGFIGASTPAGTVEEPLNPVILALESQASFVARSYALDAVHLKNIIIEAVEHKGFSFIDVLQPCLIFHRVTPYFQKNIYKIGESHDPTNLEVAVKLAREWDYSFDKEKKVAIGIFYKSERPTLEEKPQLKTPWYKLDRKIDWKKLTEDFIK